MTNTSSIDSSLLLAENSASQIPIARGLEKIDRDLLFLTDCFREVLADLGQNDLAASLPWSGADLNQIEAHESETHENEANGRSAQSRETSAIEYSNSLRHAENGEFSDVRAFPPRAGQAFAIVFQLLNMVEENAAAQTRRARESTDTARTEPGLWAHQLRMLQRRGFESAQIAAVLKRVRVEPVLTAHPTEAKRLSVLEAHRALYGLLEKRENPIWTRAEQAAIREEIKASLERLWRSGEILLAKPEVSDERRNVLYFLREVFPAVLPDLDARLRGAWQSAGFDVNALDAPEALPRLRFGTWVGGDRDGHPLVTAQVTQETLDELRLNALILAHRQLTTLVDNLSLSQSVQTPPPRLMQAISNLSELLGERAHTAPLYADEPWRRFAALMRARLPLNLSATQIEYSNSGVFYRRSRELQNDLNLLYDSLVEIGARRLAEAEVRPVQRSLSVFGFHLAALDVRQNSAFHEIALDQLLQAAGFETLFSARDEEERLRFLNAELRSPRPFLLLYGENSGEEIAPEENPPGDEAAAVLSCHRVLARHLRTRGHNGLGALIVSMTRQLSDLLAVYVLAREAGLAVNSPGGLVCKIPVVPLFETLDDLNGSAAMLRAWLEHPMTRRSLQAQSRDGKLVQQVMVGYSDSNKDSGIFASQWGLQRAQNEMAEVGRQCGVQIRFFHGRGGTVSRGAGPTHRFLEALPAGSLSGDLRLTEQGETFAQKYANRVTATYNLELLLAGVTATTLAHEADTHEEGTSEENKIEADKIEENSARNAISSTRSSGESSGENSADSLAKIADRLSAWSRDAYRDLLQTDGFMEFFGEATPIDALEHSRIGSRPSRRTGRKSLDDLRAIPWVFGWNQARFYLPGWFGVGAALQKLAHEDAAAFADLKANINDWPFLHYLLTNVETTLASADETLMHEYSNLVRDTAIRTRFQTIIESEFQRTRDILDEIFGHTFASRRPRMAKTLGLRSDALRQLHLQQIGFLRGWRDAQNRGDHEAADAMLPQLLLSINAIASGLRTTG